MLEDNHWNKIASIIMDALDVDIQLFIGKTLKNLTGTPSGEMFADWAKENPIQFGVLIRTISVLAQRIPNDNNLLKKAIINQLERLPVELHRTVFNDKTETINPTSNYKSFDSDFNTRFEIALEDLSDEDLLLITKLSQKQKEEWVNSPKKLRPFLLKKFIEDNPLKVTTDFLEDIHNKLSDSLKEARERSNSKLKIKPNKK